MKFQCKSTQTLVEQVQQYTGGSATGAKKSIRNADIFIDGIKACEPNPVVATGSLIELRKRLHAENHHLAVIYEDNYLLAIDKPAGVLTSGYSKNEKSSIHALVNQSMKHKGAKKSPLLVVHRLDQKVSGVLLFAKSPSVLKQLQDHWRDYEKCYHALVQGAPPQSSGKVESWLSENQHHKVSSGPQTATSKFAVTHYEIEKKLRNYTLLKIKLETGRKNQIRVHMADLGCPIAGDDKYGATTNPLNRIGLHATSFSLKHPVTKEKLVLRSPMPASFLSN